MSNAKLENLSEQERTAVLEILNQITKTGSSSKLDNILNEDWDEIPVDIHTFLHDKRYLGNALYDNEGRFTIFPYWESKLEEIFPDNVSTRYNTIILTGAIGLGKSTIAVICLLYLLYRLLCLKDPYLYYGLQPIDKISVSFLNITIENARGVALDKLNQMILSSEWFMSHGEMKGISNLEYIPNKHIELIAASSNNQIIGRAIFASFEDEVNFSANTTDVEKMKKKMKSLISQVDARMKSRFLRGTYLPTLNIIASSKNSDQSFLDEYINTKKKNESKKTLIVDEPQWVVDSRKDSDIKFQVAIGNKFLANELLPLNSPEALIEEYRAKGYNILDVPIGYYENFADNIDGALTDIAGISTASSLKYISGMRWNEIKSTAYKNPFVKEIIEVGNGKDDFSQYSDFFDLSAVPESLKRKPLFIHLDMSKSGDKTGIAGVYIIGKKPSVEGVDSSKELFYQVAFSVSIKAPKGREISFDKNRTFIRWLRSQGFKICGVSSDTFQSAQIQQQLTADNFNVETISVDRVDKDTRQCLPYSYLKSTIYERRLVVYDNCPFLTEEVVGLERESDGHINHPENGTVGSKDSIDSLCLDGSTEIFLLSGENRTISDLYENGWESEWVLSYDTETSKLKPIPIESVIDNGVKDNIVKLTLDNGESVICTDDHLILGRDGKYIEAGNSLGCSLMPFSYEQRFMYKNRDYTYVYNPNDDGSTSGIYLHKLVAESEHSHDKELKLASKRENEFIVIHHKDCNRKNNNPDNLEYLTNTEHSNAHAMLNSSELKRKQLSEAAKRQMEKGEHPFQRIPKEQRVETGRKSLIKINKSDKHRAAVSSHNKLLASEGKLIFQQQWVKDKARSDEVNAKRAATCRARYCANSPFESQAIQDKMRKSCLENNGYDNPFHSKEKQHDMDISKIKNLAKKVYDYYGLSYDEQISYSDYVIAQYILGSSASFKKEHLMEAGINIADFDDFNYDEYARLRNKGSIVKLFIKSTGKESFTYEEFSSWYHEMFNTNEKFRNRVGKISNIPSYSDIVKLGFKLKNHRVIKIERLDSRHVYDIKLGDVHNFALTSGIIVHNCGALWNASKHAEEYSYEYGENVELFTEFNSESDTDEIAEFELQLMSRNKAHTEHTKGYEQFGINPPEDFEMGVSEGVFIW